MHFSSWASLATPSSALRNPPSSNSSFWLPPLLCPSMRPYGTGPKLTPCRCSLPVLGHGNPQTATTLQHLGVWADLSTPYSLAPSSVQLSNLFHPASPCPCLPQTTKPSHRGHVELPKESPPRKAHSTLPRRPPKDSLSPLSITELWVNTQVIIHIKVLSGPIQLPKPQFSHFFMEVVILTHPGSLCGQSDTVNLQSIARSDSLGLHNHGHATPSLCDHLLVIFFPGSQFCHLPNGTHKCPYPTVSPRGWLCGCIHTHCIAQSLAFGKNSVLPDVRLHRLLGWYWWSSPLIVPYLPRPCFGNASARPRSQTLEIERTACAFKQSC